MMIAQLDTIIVVGPPQSGKTTASKFFERNGFKRISASEVIRRLDDPNKPITGRREVIARGELMLREQGPRWFAEMLLSKAEGHSKVVFDGIRPLKTVEHIVLSRPGAKLLFIQANEGIRRRRFEKHHIKSSILYNEILNAEVEQTALGVTALSDIVDNERTIEELHSSLRKYLVH
jgi:dephospho-CoA kinase